MGIIIPRMKFSPWIKISRLDSCFLAFLASCVLYISYQAVFQPKWFFSGEMWAEAATNYFENANAPSLFDRIFSTDFGYIPLPQRVLALIGTALRLNAATIPFFYNWGALIISGILVSIFCLSPFRIVLKDDLLRFVVCQAILIVCDFQTKTFISFSYFSGFFIISIIGIALLEPEKEVPWYAWFIPIFLCSKPAVLSVMPAMFLVGIYARSRFKRVTLISLVFSILQIAQLFVSKVSGKVPSLDVSSGPSPLTQVVASINYFFGFIGSYFFKRTFMDKPFPLVGAGVLVVFVSMTLIKDKKQRAFLLVVFSTIFFNLMINCFAMSKQWTLDLKQLGGNPVHRQNFVSFSALILFVSFLCNSVVNKKVFGINWPNRALGVVLFFAWFTGTGWLKAGFQMARESSSPWIFNSQWQNMSRAIDKGLAPLCVSIDPLNWVYGKDCKLLSAPQWGNGSRISLDSSGQVVLMPEDYLVKGNLLSLGLMAIYLKEKPLESALKLTAQVQLKSHSVISLEGAGKLMGGKGLIQLNATKPVPVRDIQFIRLSSNQPCFLELVQSGDKQVPLALWMGN